MYGRWPMAAQLQAGGSRPSSSRLPRLTTLMAGFAVAALVLTSSVGAASVVLHPKSAIPGTALSSTHAAASWAKVSARPSPPGVSYAMMSYDAADAYIVLFGGDNSYGLSNQTWEYLGGSWTLLHPKQSPPARVMGMMAYDSKNKFVVLYGGTDGGSVFFNDTWTFTGGQWSYVNVTSSPGPLAAGSMTYDPAIGHVVLYGGWYDPCSCVDWIYTDLYEFANGNWTVLPAKGANSTLPGFGPSISYDPRDHYLVEFGGAGPYSTGATTWNYSHGGWTELNPSRSPSWRNFDSLVFDPKLGHLIMFGGVHQHGAVGSDSTWRLIGGSWTEFHTALSPPAEIRPAAAAYDAVDGYIVLFGGANSSGPSNATWVFA